MLVYGLTVVSDCGKLMLGVLYAFFQVSGNPDYSVSEIYKNSFLNDKLNINI